MRDGPTSTRRRGVEKENTVKTAHPAWRPLPNSSERPQRGGHSGFAKTQSPVRAIGRGLARTLMRSGGPLSSTFPPEYRTMGGCEKIQVGCALTCGEREGRKKHNAGRGARRKSRGSGGAKTATARARRLGWVAATERSGSRVQCVAPLCSPVRPVGVATGRGCV